MPSTRRHPLHDLSGDIRLALRQLAQRPGFATVALITLALGIGAPTAIFSVVRAVLLRPLPYAEPDRLVRFGMESRGPNGRIAFDALPAAAALAWELESRTLDRISLHNDRALTLTTAEGPVRLTGVAATPNLFEVLGVRTEIGRPLTTETPDAHEIVLSHAIWLRHLAADPGVIGSSITLDGEPYRVTGVMPESFAFPTPDTAFWVPLLLAEGAGRGMLLPAVARLEPGATLAAVVQEGTAFVSEMGGGREKPTLIARTLQDQQVGGVRRVLWILMAAVSLVSLVATTNIALLLLTRGATREREVAIRLSLGAGRGLLIRQLLVEAATMAALGGVAGLALAGVALELLLRLAPPGIPRLPQSSLDGGVLLFALAVTAGSSLMFGVLSAGRTLAIDPARSLGGAARETPLTSGYASRRRLNVLAAGELALTMVLLAGAGLLLRSFLGLVLTPQGFASDDALALQITLPSSRYPTPDARFAFHERLLDRLRSLPAVEWAGLITMMPNRQPSGRFDFNPNGVPVIHEPFSRDVAEVRTASEGFFEAMGIPLIAGRTFRDDDSEGSEPVMVITQGLARHHFPNGDAVGRILYSGTGNRRVIGVVGDVRPVEAGVEPPPAAYLTIRQDRGDFRWFAGVTVVVRGRDSGTLAAAVRTVVGSLDPEMPVFNVRTLDQETARLVAAPRFSASLLAIFAGVALVLAAVGVYGVVAYAAAQRTREIGVRVALGATRRHVMRLMVRDGVGVVTTGLIVGVILSVWLARTLTGLLHDVQPADPLALGTVAMLLCVVGLAAAWFPARRATRVSAVEALRHIG